MSEEADKIRDYIKSKHPTSAIDTRKIIAHQPLKFGQKLKSIFWDYQTRLVVGSNGVQSIVVCMENGQMAGVPWVTVC